MNIRSGLLSSRTPEPIKHTMKYIIKSEGKNSPNTKGVYDTNTKSIRSQNNPRDGEFEATQEVANAKLAEATAYADKHDATVTLSN